MYDSAPSPGRQRKHTGETTSVTTAGHSNPAVRCAPSRLERTGTAESRRVVPPRARVGDGAPDAGPSPAPRRAGFRRRSRRLPVRVHGSPRRCQPGRREDVPRRAEREQAVTDAMSEAMGSSRTVRIVRVRRRSPWLRIGLTSVSQGVGGGRRGRPSGRHLGAPGARLCARSAADRRWTAAWGRRHRHLDCLPPGLLRGQGQCAVVIACVPVVSLVAKKTPTRGARRVLAAGLPCEGNGHAADRV